MQSNDYSKPEKGSGATAGTQKKEQLLSPDNLVRASVVTFEKDSEDQ